MKHSLIPTPILPTTFGLSVIFSFTLAVGFAIAEPMVSDSDSSKPVQEVEAGMDLNMKLEDIGIPEDCTEHDDRPACQVKPREVSANKIKNERLSLCIRPINASEGSEIYLTSCAGFLKILFWHDISSSETPYRLLKNALSGLCLNGGNPLTQTTCDSYSFRQQWRYFTSSRGFVLKNHAGVKVAPA